MSSLFTGNLTFLYASISYAILRVTFKISSLLDRVLDGYEKEEAKRIPLITPGPEQYR